MQVGLHTRGYKDYVTGAWRHALPIRDLRTNLANIAQLVKAYDFVALQEADAGSFRTGFLNQIEYIAKLAGFPHCGQVITRNLAPVARHALGFLSRISPQATEQHILPSLIPGRRALTVDLGPEAAGLKVVVTHLSLGASDRRKQLDYLGDLAREGGPVVVMGDLNCEPSSLKSHGSLTKSGLWVPDGLPATFPAWRPTRKIDNILVTRDVRVHHIDTVPNVGSDHLPLAVEISIG